MYFIHLYLPGQAFQADDCFVVISDVFEIPCPDVHGLPDVLQVFNVTYFTRSIIFAGIPDDQPGTGQAPLFVIFGNIL